MVQLGCALDSILLCVSAIISLELMARLLALEANGAHKTIPCPLHVQIFLIVASFFYISAVYGPIGLCFGYDVPVGLHYHISRAYAPINSYFSLHIEIHITNQLIS